MYSSQVSQYKFDHSIKLMLSNSEC